MFLAAGLLLIAAVGVAQRIGWLPTDAPPPTASEQESGKIYTCPMHPQIRQPTPGRCPICGMELVLATTAGGADLDPLSVKIAPAQRRLANIQTAPVRSAPLSSTIQTIGAIAIDESRMATIASYIDGRLERLFADYTGVEVAKGDHLAVVYSPGLYSAQVEFIETRKALSELQVGALAAVRQAQEKLVVNSRQRLIELGMTEEQIGELESTGDPKSRLTIYAPMGGTVIEKMAVEGKYIKAGEPIYRIAGLTTVWLMLELYPEDAARIRFGQRVEAEMQSLPGTAFEGRIAFIDPTVDPDKRTVGVRVEFLNEERRLRPGDYANATIFLPIGQTGDVYDVALAGKWISPMHPQIVRDAPGQCPICGMDLVPTSKYGYAQSPVEQPASMYIPRSALLLAGENSVVYVEVEPGRFEIRPVTIGPILKDKVIILSGLAEGEMVATAGNFLIDSQMQLTEKPSLIDPTRAVASTQRGNEPLDFEHVHVESLPDALGDQIEKFYAAYFAVQQSLARDEKPSAEAAATVHRLAGELATNNALPAAARRQLQSIAQSSEHLHHMDLKPSRDAFKPISHAVVTLATQIRGDRAQTPFVHFFCPMVEGGGGDWLQPGGELANPYFGSQMLRCGEQAHVFPVRGHGDAPGGGDKRPEGDRPTEQHDPAQHDHSKE